MHNFAFNDRPSLSSVRGHAEAFPKHFVSQVGEIKVQTHWLKNWFSGFYNDFRNRASVVMTSEIGCHSWLTSTAATLVFILGRREFHAPIEPNAKGHDVQQANTYTWRRFGTQTPADGYSRNSVSKFDIKLKKLNSWLRASSSSSSSSSLILFTYGTKYVWGMPETFRKYSSQCLWSLTPLRSTFAHDYRSIIHQYYSVYM